MAGLRSRRRLSASRCLTLFVCVLGLFWLHSPVPGQKPAAFAQAEATDPVPDAPEAGDGASEDEGVEDEGAEDEAASDADAPAEDERQVEPADGEAAPQRRSVNRQTVCDLIETAATQHGIPVEFFTRLIWKESSFRPGAVSPKGAQGIAQFMPGTAAERGLADPFDPVQAIPASASFLRDLRTRFGNLGLAAAAYNAGPNRVNAWLAERSGLPWETRDYVASITGRNVEDWVDAEDEDAAEAEDCIQVAALVAAPGAGARVAGRAPQQPRAPWGVQVAGNFSQQRALATFSSLQRRHSAVIGSQEPMVIGTRNPSRGRSTFYAVRLPAETREGANSLCDRLRSAGGTCVVVRN